MCLAIITTEFQIDLLLSLPQSYNPELNTNATNIIGVCTMQNDIH